jgi:acetyltransferase-like isoleucine patch superfamily enzyme
MKKRLKNYLMARFVQMLDDYRRQKLNKIKSLPNVSIDDSLFLGEDSGFDIEGVCKELKIYKNVSTRRFCNFMLRESATLIIYENVFFNNFSSINCLGYIEIGHNTTFGEGVKLYDHNHKYGYNNENKLMTDRANFNIGKIIIGNDCWIGSNVTILNNVEIGDNVIIGANNLIYKSIPSNTIVKAKVEQVLTTNN